MKRQWTPDELAEHWTLTESDKDLIANKAGATRLGFAVLLRYFHHDGRFPPYKGDVPTAAMVYVAQQLGLPPELYAQYAWTGRTMVYHRIQIRQALGFRESTEQDIDDLTTWLCQEALRHEHRPIVCRKRSMHAAGPHIWSRPRPSASTVWCAPPSTPMKTRYNGRYSIYSVLEDSRRSTACLRHPQEMTRPRRRRRQTPRSRTPQPPRPQGRSRAGQLGACADPDCAAAACPSGGPSRRLCRCLSSPDPGISAACRGRTAQRTPRPCVGSPPSFGSVDGITTQF
jgi:hypothetical protein